MGVVVLEPYLVGVCNEVSDMLPNSIRISLG